MTKPAHNQQIEAGRQAVALKVGDKVWYADPPARVGHAPDGDDVREVLALTGEEEWRRAEVLGVDVVERTRDPHDVFVNLQPLDGKDPLGPPRSVPVVQVVKRKPRA